MNVDAISTAVEKLIGGLPRDITGAASFERTPLEEDLKRELERRDAVYGITFTTEEDPAVGVLSLEEGRAALYLLLPRPMTLSRELLHLEGAIVRHVLPLEKGAKERLSVTLANQRVLVVDLPEESHELRDELEKRARGGLPTSA